MIFGYIPNQPEGAELIIWKLSLIRLRKVGVILGIVCSKKTGYRSSKFLCGLEKKDFRY